MMKMKMLFKTKAKDMRRANRKIRIWTNRLVEESKKINTLVLLKLKDISSFRESLAERSLRK
jgi:hypothetical protein